MTAVNLLGPTDVDGSTGIAAQPLHCSCEDVRGGVKGMKILLVDDHQLFREGVALLLQRLTNDLDLL
jgi:hypothetical protein